MEEGQFSGSPVHQCTHCGFYWFEVSLLAGATHRNLVFRLWRFLDENMGFYTGKVCPCERGSLQQFPATFGGSHLGLFYCQTCSHILVDERTFLQITTEFANEEKLRKREKWDKFFEEDKLLLKMLFEQAQSLKFQIRQLLTPRVPDDDWEIEEEEEITSAS